MRVMHSNDCEVYNNYNSSGSFDNSQWWIQKGIPLVVDFIA